MTRRPNAAPPPLRWTALALCAASLGCAGAHATPCPTTPARPFAEDGALLRARLDTVADTEDPIALAEVHGLAALPTAQEALARDDALRRAFAELRARLVAAASAKVRELDAIAVRQERVRDARAQWQAASFYLALLPTAATEEETRRFHALIQAHERARAAFEHEARVDYAEWAAGEIARFDERMGPATSGFNDEGAIHRAALTHLGPIRADLLLPEVALLYQRALAELGRELEDDALHRTLEALSAHEKRPLK